MGIFYIKREGKLTLFRMSIKKDLSLTRKRASPTQARATITASHIAMKII